MIDRIARSSPFQYVHNVLRRLGLELRYALRRGVYTDAARLRLFGFIKINKDIMDRYNFRSKVDFKVADWLTFCNNTSALYYTYKRPSSFYSWLFNRINDTKTLMTVKNPDGSWTKEGAELIDLAQSLLAHHHKVTIIEPQEALCRSLADSLDVPVVCGDAISFDTLRTADVASCDAFVAVTGNDEDNLVACQIAKREFGVDRTVARASNPKNRELLHTLGVDTVVCGTDNLSHILEREIETDTIRQLLSLGGGTASLNEILLPEDFAFAGKSIKDIPIPGNAILVSITRDTEFIIPHGNTVLLPWDRILCLTQDDTLHLLTDAWGLTGK